MSSLKPNPIAAALALLAGAAGMADAAVFVQCGDPALNRDPDGDAIIEGAVDPTLPYGEYQGASYAYPDNTRCMHLSAGDGFVTMADGRPMYEFGFDDVTGLPEAQVMNAGMLAQQQPGPTIVLDEGDEFYLNLTNVGMVIRPDLFDPHTVHWHGFPEAASIFDGVPEESIAIKAGATLTYYFNVVEPGTYLYHCHVEATEHMQMGMLANLYVRPAQNRLPDGTVLQRPGSTLTHTHANPDYDPDRNLDNPLIGDRYAYNDKDGATRYDVEYPIQLLSFDPAFHDANWNVQPLPFADMRDTYAMINGRGYPDTADPAELPPPPPDQIDGHVITVSTQPISSLIQARVGDRLLLRISNVNVTRFYTLTAVGLPPMRVVGRGARILRGNGSDPDGADLSYETQSVTLGGGEARDVIIDLAGVEPGTYFLYTSNLNYLSNDAEDYGGMMTEIVVSL